MAQRDANRQTSELALGDHSGIRKIGTFQQYLVVFFKFSLYSTIHEGGLSTEEVLPNGAIAVSNNGRAVSRVPLCSCSRVKHQLLSKSFQW